MKKDHIFYYFLFLCVILQSCSGKTIEESVEIQAETSLKVRWAHNMGTTGSDTPDHLAIDSAGNIYMLASSNELNELNLSGENKILRGNTYTNFFLQKYTSSGELVWSRNIEGSEFVVGYGLAVDDSSNVVVTGLFTGDLYINTLNITETLHSPTSESAFLARFTSDGTLLWVRKTVDSGFGFDVTVDDSGKIYLLGSLSKSVEDDPYAFLNQEGGMFVQKFSTSGDLLLEKIIRNQETLKPSSIAVSSEGDIYIYGLFYRSFNFGASESKMQLKAAGNEASFLLKLSTLGEIRWVKKVKESFPEDMRLDKEGNIYVSGMRKFVHPKYGSCEQLYITKLNSSGNHLWNYELKGDDYYYRNLATSFFLSDSGYVYVLGHFKDAVRYGKRGIKLKSEGGEFDLFVMKMTSSGSPLWVERFGGKGWEVPHDIVADAHGNLTISFSYMDNFSVGSEADKVQFMVNGQYVDIGLMQLWESK